MKKRIRTFYSCGPAMFALFPVFPVFLKYIATKDHIPFSKFHLIHRSYNHGQIVLIFILFLRSFNRIHLFYAYTFYLELLYL